MGIKFHCSYKCENESENTDNPSRVKEEVYVALLEPKAADKSVNLEKTKVQVVLKSARDVMSSNCLFSLNNSSKPKYIQFTIM